VAFYVPLGPRGVIFQCGTLIIGVMGRFIYWRAARRRALAPLAMVDPAVLPEG
jgi:hypothetical protein